MLLSFLKQRPDGGVKMQVITQRALAAAIAALFQQRKEMAAQLIDRMDVLRKLLQVPGKQLLQIVPERIDARRCRLFPQSPA